MEMKENIIRIELLFGGDDPECEKQVFHVPGPVTAGEFAEKYCDEAIARDTIYSIVDGTGFDLSHELTHDCSIRLLTLRSRMARLVYQRTVFFLFLIALDEVIPGTELSLKYPLNGGIFVKIKTKISDKGPAGLLWKIEKRMKELAAENISFDHRVVKRQEILDSLDRKADEDIFLAAVKKEQREFIKGNDVKEIFVYSYGSTRAVFYDPLFTSSGKLTIFELVPYDGNVIIRVPEAECPMGLLDYRDDTKLYNALRDVSRWQSFVNVRTVKDLNAKIESSEWHEFILINEAIHEKKIAMIADRIASEKKRIILIAGPSSSGKTTFAQRLCIQLRVNGLKPLYMGTDDYFVERHQAPVDENGKYNFEDLENVDVELFNDQMNALLAGETVDMPVFDFITGSKRYGERITRAESDQPIVIEGIHALNRRMTMHIDDREKFRIYISPLTTLNIDDKNRIPLTDIRFIRRMARDMRSRNRSARQTIAGWPDVRKGEIRNIFPYSGEADVLFNSALLYELSMLRPLVEDSLAAVTADEPEYLEAQRLLRILRCVKPMNENVEVSGNSIMREFLGGGIWVK